MTKGFRRFEYQIIPLNIKERNLRLVKKELDEKGKDGWLLVSVDNGIAYMSRIITGKRSEIIQK